MSKRQRETGECSSNVRRKLVYPTEPIPSLKLLAAKAVLNATPDATAVMYSSDSLLRSRLPEWDKRKQFYPAHPVATVLLVDVWNYLILPFLARVLNLTHGNKLPLELYNYLLSVAFWSTAMLKGWVHCYDNFVSSKRLSEQHYIDFYPTFIKCLTCHKAKMLCDLHWSDSKPTCESCLGSEGRDTVKASGTWTPASFSTTTAQVASPATSFRAAC